MWDLATIKRRNAAAARRERITVPNRLGGKQNAAQTAREELLQGEVDNLRRLLKRAERDLAKTYPECSICRQHHPMDSRHSGE